MKLDPSFKPINRTAANVVKKGFSEEFINNNKFLRRWENPPKCRRIPRDLEDLRDVKFGRFTVIGLLPKISKHAVWLVRCVCGMYESRCTKSIKNPENYGDRCEECRKLSHIKKTDMRKSVLKDYDIRNL